LQILAKFDLYLYSAIPIPNFVFIFLLVEVNVVTLIKIMGYFIIYLLFIYLFWPFLFSIPVFSSLVFFIRANFSIKITP